MLIPTHWAAVWHRGFHVSPRLNANEPFAAAQADGKVAQLAKCFPDVAVAQPAQLGQADAAVGLIELDPLWIGIAETVGLALLLEALEIGPLGEEIGIDALQILECLLQRMDRSILEPRRSMAIAPAGQVLRHCPIADEPVARLVILLLQCQRLVIDETTRSGEAAHLALLKA